MSIAIIRTGGKQYLVKPGAKVKLEKLNGEAGKAVKFETLLTADESGKEIQVGKPKLGTAVEGKITSQSRAKKITVIKYKAKTRYKKTTGHRQQLTQVEITKA